MPDINYSVLKSICMKIISLNIPEFLELNDNKVAMVVAAKLYEQGKLSLEQAAEVAGLTKRTFAELSGTYNVSLFNYPAPDLARDVSNA